MLPFALTIFSSAFLLFQVQPLIGKFILPWFGGGPAVWTTCLLFFQALLLAGYAYAHLIARYLEPRLQAICHLALLLAALAMLPIIPDPGWKPAFPRKSDRAHPALVESLSVLIIRSGISEVYLPLVLFRQWLSPAWPCLVERIFRF